MKKLIAFVILIVMTLQSFAISLASSSSETDDLSIIIQRLTALGVISSATHEPDDLITRGEFITAVVELFNLESDNSEQIYYDVDSSNPAFDGVYQAYMMGALSIPDDKIFNPNTNITYNEAIKVLVSMLGYTEKAEAMGGYPGGYLTVANSLKIGLNTVNGSVSYYDMLKAFDNMTKIKVAVLDSIIHDSAFFDTYTDKTLLTEYHDIYSGKGVVKAVGKSNLYGDEDISDNRVIIESGTYYYEYENISDFIGCNVKFWYRDVDDIKTVLYVELVNEADVVEILAEDIVGYSNNIYTYLRESGKTATIQVEPVPFVMYNGRVSTGKTKNMYTPEDGSVRLIDSDSDGKFDVVIIKEYTTYVVETVDVDNYMIFDKFDSEKRLCFDESKGIDAKITTDDGKEVFAGVISEWSIISALVSEDGKYVRAVVSFKSVSGKIDKHSNYSGIQTVGIDGVEYDVSHSVTESKIEIPKVGSDVVCYLDFKGRIAAVTTREGSDYSYYIMLGYAPERGLSNNVSIKVLNSDNEIEVYTLTLGSKVDSKSYKTAKEQLNAIDTGFKLGCIVRMKFVDGVIYNIDTPYLSEKEYTESSITPYIEDKSKTTNLLYKASQGNVEDTFFVTNDTFVVIEYPTETDLEKRFLVANRGRLTDNTRYNFIPFAIGETFVPQVVFVQPLTSGVSITDRTIYAVTKKSQIVAENGEIKNEFIITNGTKTVTLYVEDEILREKGDINEGDIIRVDLYKENYVLGDFISKIYDYETGNILDTSLTTISTNSLIAIRKGYVYDKIGSYMSYVTDDDKTLVTNIPSSIIKISKERGKVKVESASATDLKAYKSVQENRSDIIIKYQWRIPYELIIIER